MAFQGKLQAVYMSPIGAQLEADAALGATTLYISSIDDFDEAGGSVSFGEDSQGKPSTTAVAYSTVVETENLALDVEGASQPPTCTMTLPVGLSAGLTEGTRVYLYPYGEEKIGQVLLTNNADEAVEVKIPHEFAPLIDDGIRDEAFQETVIVDTDSTGAFYISGVVGMESVIQAKSIYTGGGVSSDGVAPPQVVGVTVRGGIRTVLLEWPLVINPDPVTYNVYGSTISGFTTDATTFLGTAMGGQFFAKQAYNPTVPGMVNLANGTTYYFRVSASDVDGEGVDSSEVSGTPIQVDTPDIAVNAITADRILANQITADKLATTLALISQLYIGSNITLFPTESSPGAGDSGLTVNLNNGGVIQLPADGSNAEFLKVILEATSILVQDNFELRGALNKIAGTLALGLGAVAPTTGPTVGPNWDVSDASQGLTVSGASLFVLCDDGATNWISTSGQSPNTLIVSVNKTTGAVATLSTYYQTSGETVNGIVKVGTDYYVQVYDSALSRSGIVDKFNSSWVFQSRWTASNDTTSRIEAGIATDGTYLYMCGAPFAQGYRRLYRYALNGTGATQLAQTANLSITSSNHLFVSNADFGALRWGFADVFTVRVFAATGNPATAYTASNFDRPSSTNTIAGLVWDGTNFRLLAWGSGATPNRIWKMSTITTDTARSVRYSQYDADATGGTHETAWSPAVAYTHKARGYFKVSSPAPLDSGGTDDPNAIRHYIQNAGAGSYYRQADVTASPWSASYAVPSVAGATAVSTPDFTGVVNPGIVQSTDDGTHYILLKGDGSGRAGPMSWNNLGVRTSDTGWITTGLVADNSSTISSTRYRIIDGMFVEFVGRVTLGANVTVGAGGIVSLFDLMHVPAGLIPSYGGRYGAMVTSSGSGFAMGEVIIQTDGHISITRAGVTSGTISSGATVNFTLFYMI